MANGSNSGRQRRQSRGTALEALGGLILISLASSLERRLGTARGVFCAAPPPTPWLSPPSRLSDQSALDPRSAPRPRSLPIWSVFAFIRDTPCVSFLALSMGGLPSSLGAKTSIGFVADTNTASPD